MMDEFTEDYRCTFTNHLCHNAWDCSTCDVTAVRMKIAEKMTDNEALEALTDKSVVNPYLTLEALDIAIDALRERAERKTGKWIDHSEEGYVECPMCGHLTTCEGNIEDLHYCFWCGNKMEVEE